MSRYLTKIMAVVGLFIAVCAYGQDTGAATAASAAGTINTPLTLNSVLAQDNNALAATLYPKMQLLTGPVLVAKFLDPGHFAKADAYTGGGFIIGVYLGKDDLNNINSPILVADLSQVKVISDLTFFQTYDPQKSGYVSAQGLRAGHLILMYYNTNGYLLMRDMVNFGVQGIYYDIANNHVNLVLAGVGQDKFLQGEIINF